MDQYFSAWFPLPPCVLPGLAYRANNFVTGVYMAFIIYGYPLYFFYRILLKSNSITCYSTLQLKYHQKNNFQFCKNLHWQLVRYPYHMNNRPVSLRTKCMTVIIFMRDHRKPWGVTTCKPIAKSKINGNAHIKLCIMYALCMRHSVQTSLIVQCIDTEKIIKPLIFPK